MNASPWDPVRVAQFFDGAGEREWERFNGQNSQASLASHVRFLERFVRPGDRVLDAGAGPGRFTIELVRLGAEVVALDLSAAQLALLRERVDGVETVVGDITDLSGFADGSFDVVVCFGGPLSYLGDDAARAVAELVRVAKPGGHLLVSVMSLIGVLVHYASEVLDLARRDGIEKQLEIVRSGLLPEEPGYGHLAMRLYRWSELDALLGRHGTVVAGAAAGLLPTIHPEEPELAQFLVDLEAAVGDDEGALAVGQHILAALELAA